MSFSIPEILALIGMIQCTYLLVHVLMRGRQIAHAGLPLLYFLVLGLGFTADLAQSRLQLESELYFYIQWALWFIGPPLSVLVVIQLADMARSPLLRDYWVILLVPLSFMLSFLAADTAIGCSRTEPCEELREFLLVTGLMAGTISLLVIFSKKDLLKNVAKQRFGRERYWLIFFLIILNTLFLFTTLLSLTKHISVSEAVMLRNVLGLGFVYLVSTSLLRLFPKNQRPSTTTSEELSPDDRALAQKIEHLLQFDKVYQEPTYSRANLAQECGVSETVVSRVINLHFGKSFPQLMNEHRIEDAKQLLKETSETIQNISRDVGFNSLPSFNRVFKDMTGKAPSQYRKKAS